MLEISAWNQANALRQVTVKRGLDVRDFTLTTFGGSGSLLLCRLMDILGIPTVLVPPNPGNVSAFGLLTVDVKNDYVQTHVSLAERLDSGVVTAAYDALTGQAADALAVEGFAPEQHVFQRTADLRYFGQAFEVRVARAGGWCRRGVRWPRSPTPSTRSTARSTATTSRGTVPAGRVGEPAGVRHRADHAPGDQAGLRRWFRDGTLALPPRTSGSIGRPVCFDAEAGYVDTPVVSRTDLPPGSTLTGPVIVEEFGSTVPIHPGFEVRVDEYLNLIVTRSDA